jgi:dTDP-4-dehydrorhamnose reductase
MEYLAGGGTVMTKTKVALLGSQGMLGSAVLNVLSQDKELNIQTLDRPALDARTASVSDILRAMDGPQWIINAVGKIKPYIQEDNHASIDIAIRVNSLFPYALAEAAQRMNAKVIQIATDCVYSGKKGNYREDDSHNPSDSYGKTKSLGEVEAYNFYNLRCSIIGPEVKNHLSLMDWFLNQPKGAEVNGFTNHWWNGVTTLAFARICQGIVKSGDDAVNDFQHIIPANTISKADLLKCLAREFGREDITINEVQAPMAIDRTLATNDPLSNGLLWDHAGYDALPTIKQMIGELYEYQSSS